MTYSQNDIELFKQAGIVVENKDYNNKEVEKLKIQVTDFIMNQSSKDINQYREKFEKIL